MCDLYSIMQKLVPKVTIDRGKRLVFEGLKTELK